MQKQIKFIYAVLIITIIGAGATFSLVKYGNLEETQNKDTRFIEIFNSKKELPTSFRNPTPFPEDPHIVDAEIENNITIPECNPDICLLQIIKNIKGVPSKKIIEVNSILTNWIFYQEDQTFVSDIRDPKQRILDKNLDIDNIQNEILYIDKGIISYATSSELFFEGAAHPARDPLSYGLIDLNLKDINDVKVIEYDDYSKVIEYFYPNGQDLLIQYRKNMENQESCLEDDFADINWGVDFLPNTKELIFYISYPYYNIGPCSGTLEIGIPIADVLNEVPQYVPKDSVLWKFAD